MVNATRESRASGTAPGFMFPQIKRVELAAFSLYALAPNVALQFEPGVTCLAGANGIGKSTYLATINYALTGAVPDPRRRFLSAAAYLREAQDFTAGFFDGRIGEGDRDLAAITIDFSVGKQEYSLTRGLFDPADVRKLSISGSDKAHLNKLTPGQREIAYKQSLCSHIGLSSFEQYVFLQHFLLTFDESRHLLFWDESASAQMLYLCFGGDPQEASKADQLNRDMEKAGSWGRNLQFQVNNLSKSIDILEKSLSSGDASEEIEKAASDFKRMSEELSAAVSASERSDGALNESDLRVAQATAALATARAEYNDTFERFLNGTANPSNHPVVHQAVAEEACPVCGTSGPLVAATIVARLKACECPLCSSQTSQTGAVDPRLQESLKAIDVELDKARRGLEEVSATRVRLAREALKARDVVSECNAKLQAFEEANRAALESIRGAAAALAGPVQQNLASLREARVQLIVQRDAAYKTRDSHRTELRVLQKHLEQRYATAEQNFVPRFRDLAGLFLGIDLDISLVSSQSTGMKLELEMRGDSRRQEHDLSESQRFFIDIALRMALAQYISSGESPAGLCIDTPEGSLDIAYEDRAGEMFAHFVQSGHDLLMTANINSSKLLTTLARVCGAQLMAVIQMTNWTELSDVQQKATELFQSAYADITAALSQGSVQQPNAQS